MVIAFLDPSDDQHTRAVSELRPLLAAGDDSSSALRCTQRRSCDRSARNRRHRRCVLRRCWRHSGPSRSRRCPPCRAAPQRAQVSAAAGRAVAGDCARRRRDAAYVRQDARHDRPSNPTRRIKPAEPHTPGPGRRRLPATTQRMSCPFGARPRQDRRGRGSAKASAQDMIGTNSKCKACSNRSTAPNVTATGRSSRSAWCRTEPYSAMAAFVVAESSVPTAGDRAVLCRGKAGQVLLGGRRKRPFHRPGGVSRI